MNVIRNISAIFKMSILLGSFSTAFVQAESTAVFGLYNEKIIEDNKGLTVQLERLGTASGCSLRREGNVNQVQGNYQLNKASGFFLFECEAEESTQIINQSLLRILEGKADNIVLLEGPVSQFGMFGLATAAGERSYIIKMSDYNNHSPKRRNLDLQALGKTRDALQYHYKPEAYIRVNEAIGMRRPDEVVVVYYDSPGEAEKFRSQNEPFIEQIGRFNMDHLSQFSYLFITSNR